MFGLFKPQNNILLITWIVYLKEKGSRYGSFHTLKSWGSVYWVKYIQVFPQWEIWFEFIKVIIFGIQINKTW